MSNRRRANAAAPRSGAVTHVLRSDQFTRQELEKVFRLAARYESMLRSAPQKLRKQFAGKTLVNMFYEPSTRTRMSFAFAASHLGVTVHGTENAKEFSSAIKGETPEDTARMLGGYFPDLIVVRHNRKRGPERMASVSRVPIINAGAGRGEHPTQALLDLYTIWKKKGRIDGLTVVIGGDLKNGRTARSLASMLCLYRPARIIFVSPKQVRMGKDVLARLKEKEIAYEQVSILNGALAKADVVYWTRVQKERMPEGLYKRIKDRFIIGLPQVQRMKQDAILMHPLPRVNEIRKAVDGNHRAHYFKQAENGLYVRMALIALLLRRQLKLRP